MPTQTAELLAADRMIVATQGRRPAAAQRDDIFENLTTARAIGYAVLISLPFWALLGFAIHLMR